MADAWSILNHGNLINFVTPNTEDLQYAANGVYITDTFTAEIGLELKPGEQISFQIDNGYFKNSTISETGGIQGDPVSVPDSSVLQTMYQYYIDTDDCAKSYTLGNNFRPALDHQILIAAHLKFDNGWGDTYTVGLAWDYYDGTSGQFVTIPQNYNGNYMHTQDMGAFPPYFIMESCFNASKTNYEPRLNNFYQGFGHPLANAYIRQALLGTYRYATSFATNIPIFDTQEHARAYLQDNSASDGLLNGASPTDPEEEYEKQFDFWYIKNVFGQNTRSLTGYTHARNYRFYPLSVGKIALLKQTPTSSEPYNYKLITDFEYSAKGAGAFEYDDDDYTPATTWFDGYLKKSISFGENDYYTVFKWDTNIPTADSMEDIEDYFAGRKTIDEIATNWKDIARQVNELIAPDLPGLDLDDTTPTGSNGMVYTYGAKLYEISNIKLAALFSEMFTPQNLQAILDGNKLFGADIFNAISNILYLPLSDLSEICSFGSGSNNIWIGSWESHNAQGRLISANDKVIDCGSFFFADNYGDFRSFDPYQRLYCMIPFCGFFELVVSKYIGKTVSCKIAIDITTGGVLAMLFADGIMLDQFSGQCGASRPVTARDSATYFSNIVNAITGAGGTFGNATKGAGQAAAKISGASSGAAIAGGAAMGVGVAAVGAVGGTLKAYQIKEAIDSPPIMSSGVLAGCMGYFSNTKVHFIVAQKKTIRPLNELETIGYPSNMGGTVGSFSGFLQCSAFKLANGFTGTEREREAIMTIVKNGIYVE